MLFSRRTTPLFFCVPNTSPCNLSTPAIGSFLGFPLFLGPSYTPTADLTKHNALLFPPDLPRLKRRVSPLPKLKTGRNGPTVKTPSDLNKRPTFLLTYFIFPGRTFYSGRRFFPLWPTIGSLFPKRARGQLIDRSLRHPEVSRTEQRIHKTESSLPLFTPEVIPIPPTFKHS